MSTESIQKAVDYIQSHRDKILTDYADLLRFPSISADPAYKEEVQRCAEWVVQQLTDIGFENCRAIATKGHPVVYGEWLKAGDDKPTVLVYSHYDVQPVDPLHLWDSEPFEAEVRGDRLYARGASDNKAGIWGNLKVFEAMLNTNGELPLNIKVMFEGEEESGSPSIEAFINANKDLLKADVMLNCDGNFNPDDPRLYYAGRGIVGAEVNIAGPKADLHSGQFGGIVQNPLHIAGKIIGSFHDDAGRIQLSNFYDDVAEVTDTEKTRIQAGFKEDDMKAMAGVDTFWGESIAPPEERATVYPTLDVNGMWGGYQGPGGKTIIPAEAFIKITMRLTPNQNPHTIAMSLKSHVEKFATDGVKVDCRIREEGWPFVLETEGQYLDAVQSAINTTIGKQAQLVRTGGSIPILGFFNRLIGLPIIAYGYADGELIHSPNENIRIDTLFTGLEGAIRLYHNLGNTSK